MKTAGGAWPGRLTAWPAPGRATWPTIRPTVRLAVSSAAWLAVLMLGVLPPAQATDSNAGRQKAQACAVCHGPLGLSVTPDAPHLAGQPALYTAAQLRAYRSGARKHEIMAVMAKSLTDEDISQLAAWFASLRVEVQPPP